LAELTKLSKVTWMEWLEVTDFNAPRGLECYVPALAALRAELWPHLSKSITTMLHLADYLGLEKALAARRSDLEQLEMSIPGPIWERCASLPSWEDGSLFGVAEQDALNAIGGAFGRLTK
jgi:hypothetical protein